jgi:hypothetical protein
MMILAATKAPKGKPSGDGIRLSGTQVWTYMDKAPPHTRLCTVDLTRGS